MGSRLVTRILVLFTALLLIGALIFGLSVIRQRLSKANQAGIPDQIDTAEAQEGTPCGPFMLRLTYPKIGNQNYVSFYVYYIHEGAEELWYTCGRMFPVSETESIDWSGSQYDIAVTLKDGRRELFAYDGNNNWQ